jgi:Cu(I)/Ag(I) efflux system membrane fusion protein
VREARRKYLDEGRLKTAPAAARGESAPLPELPPAERDRITPPAGALLARYLDLARALARDEEEVAAAAGRDLLPLAKELRTGASQTALEPTAGELERAAKAIQGKPLAELRKGLRPLSDALITIVKRVPAAAKRTPGLKVIHCPMYPGSWLQTADEVTNPYYGAKMLRCGEVVFEVAPAEGVRQPVAERSGGKG